MHEKAEKHYLKYRETTSKQELKEHQIDLKLTQLAYSKKAMSADSKLSNQSIKISNMGPTINSKGPEYAPSISNDGKYLMFTSRRADTKGGNVDQYFDHQYFSDIYLSMYSVNNKWSAPSNKIGKTIPLFTMHL